MWQYVSNPMAWLAVFAVSLPFWYLVFRLLFRAYYRSRMEYHQEYMKRRKEHEPDTQKSGGTPIDG